MFKNPVTTFHHEVRRLPNGNFLVLAMTERMSAAQGPLTDIVGDTILVLDSNLQLLWAWDSFDHLDVSRAAVLGETCNVGPGQCVLLNASTANDWLHGNSVSLAPDGNLIYSARHQDLVYKIAYQNGTGDGHVIWRLGKDGDFTWNSSDPWPWFSHQHDAQYEDATTLSIFDNGNTRVEAIPGNSRGQGLILDETNRTVNFAMNADLGEYSFALGSAQRLLNGNYVFGDGWVGGAPVTQVPEWTPPEPRCRMCKQTPSRIVLSDCAICSRRPTSTNRAATPLQSRDVRERWQRGSAVRRRSAVAVAAPLRSRLGSLPEWFPNEAEVTVHETAPQHGFPKGKPTPRRDLCGRRCVRGGAGWCGSTSCMPPPSRARCRVGRWRGRVSRRRRSGAGSPRAHP